MSREIWSMNFGWKFHDGDIAERNFNAVHQDRYQNPQWIKSGNNGVAKWGYDDADWQDVRLPHDFVHSRGQFSPQVPASLGSLEKGIGWYRKSFELPKEDEGKVLSLEFDGVYRNCSVWLNGHFLGRNLCGYNSFSYDITDVVNYGGANVVAVRVDATENEGWWYEGGGIYRDVRLVKTDRLHVVQWGTFVTTELKTNPHRAVVTIATEVLNQYEQDVHFELCTQILDPDGQQVTEVRTAAQIHDDEQLQLTQEAAVADPRLWSIDEPHLYTAITRLKRDGQVIDTYETTFGISTVLFDPDQGFVLNGTPTKLKGVCCHEDHAGVGMAMPKAVIEYRIQRLKEMGCNAYRTSHNPPSPWVLEACDRLGMVVIDEVRQTDTSEEAKDHLRSLIRRDRNHPSVILWSLGNEEMNIQGTPAGVRILHRMQRLAHQLDPTRKCTYGMNADWLNLTDFHEEHGFHIDVHGFNYMMLRDWQVYDKFREKYPNACLVGTENASTLSTRGLYAREQAETSLNISAHGESTVIWSNPRRAGIVSAYGETYPKWGAQPEEAWKAAAEKPYVAGLFVWTGFDYRGETFPYEWPTVVSHYGIMDLCGFAKDVYYYYQARWTEQPVLHLFPHWNWQGREGEVVDVWAFSNMDEIELFLNGRSLGKQDVPEHGHVQWQVPYEAGKLTAYGYQNGEQTAKTVVETTSQPAKIALSSGRTELQADQEDVCVVQVAITDDEGRFVADANEDVTFTIEGPGIIIGTGNGDPNSHEDDKQPRRKTYHGLCQVLVQSTTESGEIRLIVEGEGLETAQLTIQTKSADVLPVVSSLQDSSEAAQKAQQRDAADGGV